MVNGKHANNRQEKECKRNKECPPPPSSALTAVPERSQGAVIASEAVGELDLGEEVEGTIRSEELPFGGGAREVLRVARRVQTLQRNEAVFRGLGTLGRQRTDGPLEPSFVIGRHFVADSDDLKKGEGEEGQQKRRGGSDRSRG